MSILSKKVTQCSLKVASTFDICTANATLGPNWAKTFRIGLGNGLGKLIQMNFLTFFVRF